MTPAFFRLEGDAAIPLPAAAFTAHALDPQASVAIEACAGSGKTWLLVARIVRCLLAGAAPGEILAITFTRRAAQEMRERLLARLRLLATAPKAEALAELARLQLAPDAARAALPRARGLLEALLEAEPAPTIETFHGWFLRLLALAPLASGVPRRLTTAQRPGALRDAAWRSFCAELLKPEAAALRSAFESLVDEFGASDAERLLRQWLARHTDVELAIEAGLNAERLRRDFQLGQGDPAVEFAADPAVRERVQALLRLVAPLGEKPKEAAKLALGLAAVTEAPATLDTDAALDWLDQLAEAVLTKSGELRKLSHLDRALAAQPAMQAQYRTLLAELGAAVTDARARCADAAACALSAAALACFGPLAQAYRAVKAAAGEIDFDDIEAMTVALLRDEAQAAAVHARLDQRYRQVLIDEVQDTNPLQWRVLQDWLAAYGGDGARPAVFLVGDPKQSIYRFRRAEPRLFAAAARWLQTDYGALRLRTDHTRRNAPAIVELLNRALPGAHPAFAAHTTESAAEGAVRLLAPVALPEIETAENPAARDPLTEPPPAGEALVALLQGARIAQELNRWVGRFAVHGAGAERPARWGDVLLLVRSRTHLAAYERALREAGIPYLSNRPGGLLDTLEAEDLQALLSFLIAPFSDLNLAHALRTPLLGCTDEDLIALAAAGGGHWWSRLQRIEWQPRLAAARERLTRWREWAQRLPVHDLLDRIFWETDALAAYAAAVPPAARERTLANLRAYLELALEIDAGRYPSLPRFLHALAEYRGGAEQDAPGEGITAGDDAVRILTIHEAKGLEAPIVVVVPGTTGHGGEHVKPLVVWPPEVPAPVHVSIVGRKAERGRARNSWFDEEARLAESEDLNLLYVALTRARQVLIVSGSTVAAGNAPPKPHPWFQRLAEAMPDAVVAEEPGAALPAAAVPTAGPVIDYRPAPLRVGERKPRDDSEPRLLGRALHKLLEWATRDGALTLPAVGAVAAALSLTEAQARQVAESAQTILTADALRSFFDPARYRWARAELELIAPDAVHRPDRVVDVDGLLWVLDFKWQVLEAERAGYREQLERYRRAAQLAFAAREVRTALIDRHGALHEEPAEQAPLSPGEGLG
ncbi:MAG: UvrD-helicase domain-containing protein [Burkholderiales bacterium]|jgi:ATP-dependent helicase/nuclease subunit A|nr:UvrD-helicase domain-containing protein [Burkholderiales bacterium]